MKKIVLTVLLFSSLVCFGQQLTNSNMELWTTQSYGAEPNNWEYYDGTGLVYGTNNLVRGFDGVDPLTTTKITGSGAFGGSGNSVLLETKAAVGTTLLSNGYTTIPGYLYRQEAITNTNIGSLTFKYKASVVQGDSCFVKVGLIDANFNIYSYGAFWIKPSNNSSSWLTKTIILENQMPGTPTEIFIEAMSTYDEAYAYNTPIIGTKLYLDNFTLNYCNSAITTNLNETICDYMLPYTWNGLTFTSAGNQSATFTSVLGCDSTVNMTLNVIPGPFTLVPDAAFEQKLIDLGLDLCGLDGKVPTSNISNLLTLSIGGGYNVTNLMGLQAFTSLENLTLEATPTGVNLSTTGVNLSTNGIDLSNNLALTNFNCNNCGLQNIDLSSNVNLLNLNLGSLYVSSGGPEVVLMNNNNIDNLDLTNNNLLQYLDIDMAGVNNLILPSNGQLNKIDASSNSFVSIDISASSSLQKLNLSNNFLINITGNNNSNLKVLNVSGNSQLTNLPLSCVNLDTLIVEGCAFSGLQLNNQTTLNWLNCKSNNLECLSIKNNANIQIDYINTLNNFNLTCIEVDDSTFSTNNPIWNANKDAWSSYNENCPGVCLTAEIEDVNIEKIKVYPNPTNSIVTVQAESEIKDITLLDLAGKTLGKYHSNSVDLSELMFGTYIIRIRYSNDIEVVKQIIKN